MSLSPFGLSVMLFLNGKLASIIRHAAGNRKSRRRGAMRHTAGKGMVREWLGTR